MAKSLDPNAANAIFTEIVEEIMTRKGGLSSTKAFDLAVLPIEEYEGRMRVNATDKFDTAVYIAAVNFYLNKADMSAHRPRGTMVLYINSEVADRVYKAAGFQVPYDEDDESMMQLCGNLCQTIAQNFKDRLAGQEFAPLELSGVTAYKNNVTEGVEFCHGQDDKQELSFYFLKHKALAIDWTMAPIPKK